MDEDTALALDEMGPVIEEMAHQIAEINRLLDEARTAPPTREPAPRALIDTVLWSRSQLDTNLSRLIADKESAVGLTGDVRTVTESRIASLTSRVQELQVQALALQAELVIGMWPGATEAVAMLDANTRGVTLVINDLEDILAVNLGLDDDGLPPPPTPRRKESSVLPWVVGGGLAAAVLIAVVASD